MSGRTYVIGDLHGCIEELERLLDFLAPTGADTLCFLGDYVDRGPAAKAVVDRLIRLRTEGPACVFLRGNHEDMFLGYLGYEGHYYGEAFVFNGGDATLASYGIQGLRGTTAAERIPVPHREFLLALQTQARFGDFLCVHAGLRPTRSLDRQSEEDLLWIREEFILSRHPFPCTVLFGHTPQREVYLDLPFKVGLDTGLVYWNKLSCLELAEKDLFQIQRGGRRIRRHSVAEEFARAPVRVA